MGCPGTDTLNPSKMQGFSAVILNQRPFGHPEGSKGHVAQRKALYGLEGSDHCNFLWPNNGQKHNSLHGLLKVIFKSTLPRSLDYESSERGPECPLSELSPVEMTIVESNRDASTRP